MPSGEKFNPAGWDFQCADCGRVGHAHTPWSHHAEEDARDAGWVTRKKLYVGDVDVCPACATKAGAE